MKNKKIVLAASGALSVFALSSVISCGDKTDGGSGGNTGSEFNIKQNEVSPEEWKRINNSSAGVNPSARNKKFDQDASDRIVLGAPWSEGEERFRVLQRFAEVYNADAEVKASPFYKQLVVQNAGNGYSDGNKQVANYLRAGNTSSFYNLTLNYSNVAARLAEYNMLLNFNSLDRRLNVDLSSFSPQFTGENTRTSFVVNAGSYILPFLKSGTTLAVNAPVLSYILDKMQENGATLKMSDSDFKSFYDDLKAKGAADREAVKELWGEVSNDGKAALSGYEVSMDTFRAFSPLTDFAKKAQDLFTKTRNNPSGQLHIIGIDDPAGTYQSQVLAANGGDDSLGVEAPTKTNGVPGASYTGLTTKGSPTQDKGKEIYDKFVETSKNGGLVFQNNAGSVRTTTLMITHRFAMGIVSTSHWGRSYIDSTKVTNSKEYVNSEVPSYSTSTLNSGVVEAATKTANYKVDYTLKKGATDKKPSYEVYLSTSDVQESALGRNGYKLDKKADDTAFKAGVAVKTETSKVLVLFQNTGQDSKVDLDKMVKKVQSAASASNSNFVYMGTGKSSRGVSAVFVLVKDGMTDGTALSSLGYTVKSITTANQLNENEIIALNVPGKWKNENPKNVVYVQGPSLIGIHSNEAGNNATRLFLKWLLSNKKLNFDATDATKMETAIEYFQRKVGYVTPTTEFSKPATKQIFEGLKNPYALSAYNQFLLVSADPDKNIAYYSPGTTLQNEFRSGINSQFSTVQNSSQNGTNAPTFDQFAESVVSTVRATNN
ncbi:P68 family surface lipoprotein [Mycoplasmopsis synoviae]|nr:P80 family lipoprotein [Mycoplasmopsis synoviae]AKB11074.1 hypothetical protein VY93_01820 [Mycoplasmopsis synoviae ATCC 25204]